MRGNGRYAFLNVHHVLNAGRGNHTGNCVKRLNAFTFIWRSAGEDNESAVGFDLRPVLPRSYKRGFGIPFSRVFQRCYSKSSN